MGQPQAWIVFLYVFLEWFACHITIKGLRYTDMPWPFFCVAISPGLYGTLSECERSDTVMRRNLTSPGSLTMHDSTLFNSPWLCSGPSLALLGRHVLFHVVRERQ